MMKVSASTDIPTETASKTPTKIPNGPNKTAADGIVQLSAGAGMDPEKVLEKIGNLHATGNNTYSISINNITI